MCEGKSSSLWRKLITLLSGFAVLLCVLMFPINVIFIPRETRGEARWAWIY